MASRVLVAYASKYGATKEIANKIGEILQEASLKVNVLSAGQVYDLTPYDAVVLGSAVYDRKWCMEAAAFLATYESSLAKIPVWLFSSGAIGKGDPTMLMNGWHFPAELQALAYRIHPRDITFFHGAINIEKLNFAEKQIAKEFYTPLGDYRDWNAITNWAVSIAVSLRSEVAE